MTAGTGVVLDELTVGYRRGGRRVATGGTAVAGPLVAHAARGELTALLGPNGIGKSTLIKTLCGMQPALAGRVVIDGEDLVGLAADEVARRIAVVLTDRVDPGFMTARELAGLGRIPHLGFGGRLGPRDHEIVDWALDAVGAGHLADRPAAEISDGERQRVLTARALAQQPSLLVLDEPTAFLDVPSRASLVALLHRLAREQGIAVLMSTHDLESALRTADRIWLMTRGGALHSGVPEQIVADGLVGAVFDSAAARFDAAEGTFLPADLGASARRARLDLQGSERTAVLRQLGREGWVEATDGAAAELVIGPAIAPGDQGAGGLTVHTPFARPADVTLSDLPGRVRSQPSGGWQLLSDDAAAAVAGDVGQVSPYFRVHAGRWPGSVSLAELYADDRALAGMVEAVAQRMGVEEFRTAASTFAVGFAARLWSITLGAAVMHRALPNLDPTVLRWATTDTGPALVLGRPAYWTPTGAATGDDVATAMTAAITGIVLDRHLEALRRSLARIGGFSTPLMWGNAASTLLSSARMIDRHRDHTEQGPADELATRLLTDPRLADAVVRNDSGGHRRRSCCLYYRVPGAGLCGDCALDTVPRREDTR